jgi:hypothetical protein
VKRNIVILLFLPLAYTQLGYYGQFIWLQWRMKEAACEARIAALPDMAFIRLPLAVVEASGKWEEEGKEFRFKDHLFDVIRSRTMRDTTWLFCLDDENEERLDRQSEEIIRTNQEHPDKKAGHSLSLSLIDMVCERPGWAVNTPGGILRHHCVHDSRGLPGLYPEIAGPPPKA